MHPSAGESPNRPSPVALPATLTERAQLVETEIADLYRHVTQVRAAFDRMLALATLRSREQTAEILQASTAQVHRWTASGQLRVVDLDRQPRYRLEDIQSFAEARLRGSTRTHAGTTVSTVAPPEQLRPFGCADGLLGQTGTTRKLKN